MAYYICSVTETPESKTDDKGKKYQLPISIQEFDDNGQLLALMRCVLTYKEAQAERMKTVWREGGTFWLPLRINDKEFNGKKYATITDEKIFAFSPEQ